MKRKSIILRTYGSCFEPTNARVSIVLKVPRRRLDTVEKGGMGP